MPHGGASLAGALLPCRDLLVSTGAAEGRFPPAIHLQRRATRARRKGIDPPSVHTLAGVRHCHIRHGVRRPSVHSLVASPGSGPAGSCPCPLRLSRLPGDRSLPAEQEEVPDPMSNAERGLVRLVRGALSWASPEPKAVAAESDSGGGLEGPSPPASPVTRRFPQRVVEPARRPVRRALPSLPQNPFLSVRIHRVQDPQRHLRPAAR